MQAPPGKKVSKNDLKVVVEKLFRIIDANGNGVLEKEEVASFFKNMAQRHQKPFDEEEFEKNWSEMDRNADEVVTENELYEFMLEKAKKEGNIEDEQE